MSEAENRALAEALFAALERMDWAAVAELFTEDGVYQDMPFETDSGGTVGHAGIIAKLEVGLSMLDRFELGVSDIWVSGDNVVVERVEVWYHPDGTVASLPVLCRLQIRDNKIAHWREYWDYNYLIAQQPETWLPNPPAPAGTDRYQYTARLRTKSAERNRTNQAAIIPAMRKTVLTRRNGEKTAIMTTAKIKESKISRR